MSPEKLRDMDREKVKNMDQETFRVSLMYDLQSMAFWMKIYTAVNGVLVALLVASSTGVF